MFTNMMFVSMFRILLVVVISAHPAGYLADIVQDSLRGRAQLGVCFVRCQPESAQTLNFGSGCCRYFGQKDEIFKYRLVGTHPTMSGKGNDATDILMLMAWLFSWHSSRQQSPAGHVG